jgi:hypothetical protein
MKKKLNGNSGQFEKERNNNRLLTRWHTDKRARDLSAVLDAREFDVVVDDVDPIVVQKLDRVVRLVEIQRLEG